MEEEESEREKRMARVMREINGYAVSRGIYPVKK